MPTSLPPGSTSRVADSEGRVDATIDTGLEYRPGCPVRLHFVRRPHRITVSDDAKAFAHAGASRRWRGVAERLERELNVNVSGSGAVWLPVVRVGPGERIIAERIAHASLAFYQDLLELE
jgi:hypothetical protein